MEINDELKEINIKNRTCYYFDDIINIENFDFYNDSLPLEKTLTFHNVIIHIKSVWNKDQNYYYYDIFLEKYSYQFPKNNDNK